MNKLRNKILTWGTVILLFAGVGCEDQDTAFPSQEEGRGRDASLTLAIGENLSRAAKDGDSMKKLVVLLVDVNSEIVYIHPGCCFANGDFHGSPARSIHALHHC